MKSSGQLAERSTLAAPALAVTAQVHGDAVLGHVVLGAGLLVSGREWLDFLSYSGGMPLFVKRVLPDQQWFDAIVAAVEQFELLAADMVAAYCAATEGMPLTERVVEMEMVI